MIVKRFLLVMIFALMPVMCTQSAVQVPAPGPDRGKLRAEHRQDAMEMHEQEMEAMKADVEKMKSSLAQMKANLLTIRDRTEMDAKAHGVRGTRHDGDRHGRPSSCADRKEIRVSAA